VKWLRFPRVLGVAACLYLVAMSVVFGYLSSENYRFVHNAAQADGTVVSLEIRPPAGSTRAPRGRTRAPKVRYVVDGHEYLYVAAHGKYVQPLRVGDRVRVLYDPANPQEARLRGEGEVLIPLLTSGFVTIALLVGFVLYRTRDLGTGAASRERRPLADPDRVAR
jgi:hypothetical protein